MLRTLILLLLAAGAATLIAPFVVSSYYIGERGVTIPGRVYHRDERIQVHDSTWKRVCEITVQYSPPDSGTTGFLNVQLPPDEYDGFHTGQAVDLRYLPAKDIPKLPMAGVLREVHALPMARLATKGMLPRWELYFTRGTVVVCVLVAGVGFLLYLWRMVRLPGFGMAVMACVLIGLAAVMVTEFPRPLVGPQTGVRHGSGKVVSLERIHRLFETRRSRGMDMAQPVSVVGVEFVPEGRIDPVVAVDLVDEGSLPGLKQGAILGVDYEGAAPRTASLQNATRMFVRRNLVGMAGMAVLYVVVIGGMLAIAHFIGKGYNRLLGR